VARCAVWLADLEPLAGWDGASRACLGQDAFRRVVADSRQHASLRIQPDECDRREKRLARIAAQQITALESGGGDSCRPD
jgi:hypothetical protein